MNKLLMSATLMFSMTATAQDTTNKDQFANPLTISGYVESYYSYDLNKPEMNDRPDFLYNYNRHNEINVNLGFIKASYLTERTRANLALGVGTYMNANYAAEPGIFKNVFEGNAGYKLSRKKDLWFDIGIIPSHIGFESAIGKDNWTLTRSLVAENTPYFEAAAKLTYTTDDGRWTLAALALNGWQRIKRVEGNSIMSWGTQVTYKPKGNVTINYSTFIGTDKPDSVRLMRYHNNLYGIFQLSEKIGIIAGLDYGFEQKAKDSKDFNQWYTPIVILRITPKARWAAGFRLEYFSDENGVIIKTGTTNGFKTFGGSLNVDYLPLPNVAIRLEGRLFNSMDDIFTRDGITTHRNSALTFSTSIGF